MGRRGEKTSSLVTAATVTAVSRQQEERRALRYSVESHPRSIEPAMLALPFRGRPQPSAPMHHIPVQPTPAPIAHQIPTTTGAHPARARAEAGHAPAAARPAAGDAAAPPARRERQLAAQRVDRAALLRSVLVVALAAVAVPDDACWAIRVWFGVACVMSLRGFATLGGTGTMQFASRRQPSPPPRATAPTTTTTGTAHRSIRAAIWASLPIRIASHALSMWLSSLHTRGGVHLEIAVMYINSKTRH